MSKNILIQINENKVILVRSELETASEDQLTEHEIVINHLYKKLNSKLKCVIVYDCREEFSMGSSPSWEAYPFINEELMNNFIKKWNEDNSKLEKSKTQENKYLSGDWRYWLEIEDGIINFQ